MTFEEAKNIFLNRGYIEVPGGTYYDADKWRNAIVVISKWLEQQSCDDCINRQAVLSYISNDLGFGDEENGYDLERKIAQEEIYNFVKKILSVTPKEKSESDYDRNDMKDYVDGEAFILGMLRKEIELIPVNCDECKSIIKQMLEIIDRYEEGFVLPFTRK